MKQLKGYVEEIDPKMGKTGAMWLLKFKFIDSDEGPVWMGAYADRKDAPKAFVQRVMAEAELPENARTIWEITANTVEERGYENLYVTSAKSSSNGHAPAADDTSAPSLTGRYLGATSRIGPSEKDVLIVRQVALKEASAITQVLMAANPKMSGDDILASVRDLTKEFTAVVLETTPAPQEEPAKEDSLFDEEPL